jgi:transposase
MEQINLPQELIKEAAKTKLALLAKEELINRYVVMEDELKRVVGELYKLKKVELTNTQIGMILEEQLGELRDQIYGTSSEKYKPEGKPKERKEKSKPSKPRVQKPSERYPNIPVVEKVIAQDPPPGCGLCGHAMRDSGMSDDSEQLTVIPKKFEIIVVKKVIYECGCCHGSLQSTPSPERIKDGSSYSDEMIIDVSLSKFCDLIPIGRQAVMASRTGLIDLPPQSLIECTHYLADFVIGAYHKLKDKLMLSEVMNADETPHRMLEGDEKKSWYLWGFSNTEVCFLECHNTRSGDVASEILTNSQCRFLITDVYSGYGKAVRIANEIRAKGGRVYIINAYCNAHARRYYFKSFKAGEVDAEFYLIHYQAIYKLNEASKGKSLDEVLELRNKMRPHFEAMKQKAADTKHLYSEKSLFGKALNYFLKNYEGLTVCLKQPTVPVDNNSQERLLRSHCVGRKTWYGTHSKKGAKTAAVLFSLVESCKLNQVNPREYFKRLTQALLAGYVPFTPCEFKKVLTLETKATESRA